MAYLIKKTDDLKEFVNDWDGAFWKDAEVFNVDYFLPESSFFHPETKGKLLYSDNGIYGIFNVKDKYVRSVRTEYNDPVCRDSCVEFFVTPAGSTGYFTLEMNCGGTFLLYFIEDCTRTKDGFVKFAKMTLEDVKDIEIKTSMPRVIDPEIAEDTEWTLSFYLPFEVMDKYSPGIAPKEGEVWRANFYKCISDCSHPHWAAWQPVPEFNFHNPDVFGDIEFA